MTKWLRKLAAMVLEIPEDFKFDLSTLPEKSKGEEEKGKLSEETAALFRLLNWLGDKSEKLGEAHEKVCASCNAEECEEFQHQASTIIDDIDGVRDIFFYSVRNELVLDTHNYPNIGVRKGGVVVAMPRHENRGIDVTVISRAPAGLMSLVESIRRMNGQPLDS